MKTTAAVNVVTLVDATGRWVCLETAKGRKTAWLRNSELQEGWVGLDEARERIATLTAAGWMVAA